jgi:hypothetical protein
VAGVPLPLLYVDESPAGAGVVVVDELEDDVVGVGASSRLVQAPSETAATSARAAHEVRDAFIGNSLRLVESSKGSDDRPIGTLGRPRAQLVGTHRACM